jgi:hypothetical protein
MRSVCLYWLIYCVEYSAFMQVMQERIRYESQQSEISTHVPSVNSECGSARFLRELDKRLQTICNEEGVEYKVCIIYLA